MSLTPITSTTYKFAILLATLFMLSLPSHFALADNKKTTDPSTNSQNKEPQGIHNTILAEAADTSEQQHNLIVQSLHTAYESPENPFDAKNYELAKINTNVNQISMIRASWSMAVLMIITIILLYWNGHMLRAANKIGDTMAKSSIEAAQASTRAAIATEKTLQETKAASMLQLRPYLSFKVTHWVIKQQNGQFYISLSVDITNNGMTPAKDFTKVTITKCYISLTKNTQDEIDNDTQIHLENPKTNNSQVHLLYARYIAPNTTITRGLGGIQFTPLEKAYTAYEALASGDSPTWKVRFLQVNFTLGFKDDFKIQSAEHYRLNLSFLSGFGPTEYVRIDSEDTFPDENVYADYKEYKEPHNMTTNRK